MTDGTRILRTLAIPLILGLVLLFFVPKTCEKALRSQKLRQRVTATAAPTDTGLSIQAEGDSPTPRAVDWPAGLTAQRAQYLIEIDPRFSEPRTVRVIKPGMLSLDNEAAEALVRAGYFVATGGGYTPAAGAALHLPGMTEEDNAWRVPLGKRKFGRFTAAGSDGKVAFTWQWEPNEAGRAVNAALELHEGKAEFAGGGEHPWALSALSVDSDWR